MYMNSYSDVNLLSQFYGVFAGHVKQFQKEQSPILKK